MEEWKALGRRSSYVFSQKVTSTTDLPLILLIFPLLPLPSSFACTASNRRAIPPHGLRQPCPSSASSPHPPSCRGGLDGGRAAGARGRRAGRREGGRGGDDAAEGGEEDGRLAGHSCDFSRVKIVLEGGKIEKLNCTRKKNDYSVTITRGREKTTCLRGMRQQNG